MTVASTLKHVGAAGLSFLERQGSPARTTVFLHGIGGQASSFADALSAWPAGPRLLAWDAPGYGQSRSLDCAWPTPDDYADRLATALDDMQLDQIDLAGQSLGGLIAAAFAARFPSRVRRLVLVSPAHGYRVPKGGPLTDALAKRVTDFDTEGATAFAAKRASRLVFEPEKNQRVASQVRATMAMLKNPGHTHAVMALASGDLLGMAARLRQQVLLLTGAEDVITPLSGTEDLLNTLRQRPRLQPAFEQLIVIPSAGHAAYLEAPTAFVRHITAFLEQAP